LPDPGINLAAYATPPSRESRRSASGLAIEMAALELFLDRGAEAVTAEDIAAAAGISRRTFFRYFGSKDDVLAAAPTRSLLRTMNEFRERPVDESLAEALVATARAATAPPDEIELMRLSGLVMARCPDAWGRALMRLRQSTDALFANAVAERLRHAGRSDDGAEVIGAALAGAVVQIYTRWVHLDCAGELAAHLESGLRHLGEAFTQRSAGPGKQTAGRLAARP
jgi:AcrR family transcriptional regulator